MWGTAGNLSARAPGSASITITPRGASKGTLKTSDLITIKEGSIQDLNNRGRIASAETAIHQAVYRAIPEARAVFHVHPIYSTLISRLYGNPKRVRPLKIEWFEMLKGVGIGEKDRSEIAIFPNWQNVAKVAQDLTGYLKTQKKVVPAFLIYNHGLTAWGSTPEQAKNRLEIIEYVCQYLFLKTKGHTKPIRQPGSAKDSGLWVSDDFDDPLPEDILRSFYS